MLIEAFVILRPFPPILGWGLILSFVTQSGLADYGNRLYYKVIHNHSCFQLRVCNGEGEGGHLALKGRSQWVVGKGKVSISDFGEGWE